MKISIQADLKSWLREALESRLRAAQEERSRLVVSVLAMSNVEGPAGAA